MNNSVIVTDFKQRIHGYHIFGIVIVYRFQASKFTFTGILIGNQICSLNINTGI